MATNKFLIFDEQGNDMMSDAEYSTASQRLSGVVPGLADAEMHNKLYRQVSIMANAIGRVLGEFGKDAPDNDVVTLAKNIKDLFCFNVLDAYPVGAIYISASSINPAQLFGGTWQQISGRFLLAADSSHAAGSTGGEASHILTTNEMPPHNHTVTNASNGAHTPVVTIASNGAHTHTATVTAAGEHTHTMKPYNQIGFDINGGGSGSRYGTAVDCGDNDGWWSGRHDFYMTTAPAHTHSITVKSNGAHTHTATASAVAAHTHTATVANTGGGIAHNNMPPYLSVYVWKRTA